MQTRDGLIPSSITKALLQLPTPILGTIMLCLITVMVPPVYVGLYVASIYRSPVRILLRTMKFLLAGVVIFILLISGIAIFGRFGGCSASCLYDPAVGEYVGDSCDN